MKNFKRQLNAEFDKIIPAQSDRLKNQKIIITDITEQKKSSFKFSFKKVVLALSMVFVFAFISVFAVLFTDKNNNKGIVKAESYASYITISINPSFSILTDENGVVSNVVADNYDGEIILSDMAFTDESYQNVIEKIINACEKAGFITSSNEINIELACKSQKKYSEIEKEIQATINSVVSNNQTATVEIKQKDQTSLKDLAKTCSDEIDDDSDIEDIFKALKNKKGYLEEKNSDQTFKENSDKIYDLLLVKVILDVAEDLSECFEELDELLEKEELSVSDLYKNIGDIGNHKINEDILEGMELIAEIGEIYSRLGKKIFLTDDNYKSIKEKYTFNLSEDEIENLSEAVENALENNIDSQTIDKLLNNESIKTVISELKESFGETTDLNDLLKAEKDSKNHKNHKNYK